MGCGAPTSTPSDQNLYATCLIDGPKTDKPLREIIGSLLYASMLSRPDISFATAYLSRFQEKATIHHWNLALKILKYLHSTESLGIRYSSRAQQGVLSYSDASYASSPEDRRSTTGYVVLRQGGAILWNSQRQLTTATSTAESETISCSAATRALVWTSGLLRELGHEVTPLLKVDNTATLALAESHKRHASSKHFQIKIHHIRRHVELGDIKLAYVPSEEQVADILNKPLTKTRFIELRSQLGISEQPIRNEHN